MPRTILASGALFQLGLHRLERPVDLATWLLRRDGNADADKVEFLLAWGDTQTIYLKEPVATYIVYFTAVDGEVVFRRDIYDRDRVLVEALRTP